MTEVAGEVRNVVEPLSASAFGAVDTEDGVPGTAEVVGTPSPLEAPLFESPQLAAARPKAAARIQARGRRIFLTLDGIDVSIVLRVVDTGNPLGDTLRSVRQSQGLSLSTIAEPAGISGTYLQRLENGVFKNP